MSSKIDLNIDIITGHLTWEVIQITFIKKL